MNILDSREEIRKIDVSSVLGSVAELAKQCQHAWGDAGKVVVPDSYKNVKNLVMCGMGGSGLGARVIESVFGNELKIPLVRINTYNLPVFVNENSLVICSSYSGTTEETVENAKQAIAKKAKWMAISTGNTLIDMAEAAKVPFYKIDPQFNPSNQPRMAIGYSIVGQLALVKHTGVINITGDEIEQIISFMNSVVKINAVESSLKNNQAKKLVQEFSGKIIVFVSAEHLDGATHVFNNQLNESAKHFSSHVSIPELNHHLMEGLKNPPANRKNLLFVFVNSRLYPKRIQQRFAITREVVEKNGISAMSINLTAPTKLSQTFELIQLGGFVSLYLSLAYGQNPEPVPWVDYFKTRLGQPLGK